MMLQEFASVLGIAGLVNPFALVIGAYMGWRCDQAGKFLVVGFAAAALSLMLDGGLRALGLPSFWEVDAGAVALFPARFIGGLGVGLVARGIFSLKCKG